MGIFITSVFILATPKVQDQGLPLKSCRYLMKRRNEDVGLLAKPQRAKHSATSFVVMLLKNSRIILCEASLESGSAMFRRINTEVIEVPYV